MYCAGPVCALMLCLAAMLSGCGAKTPEIIVGGSPNASTIYVNAIIQQVRCELKYAVRHAVWYDIENASLQADRKRRIPWIEKWGAKLAIKLLIKEKSSLNPSVSIIDPLKNMQSYTTALGGSVATQATRIVNLDYYFDFASEFLGPDFDPKNRPKECTPVGDFYFEGDLKIDEVVKMATFPYYLRANVSPKPPEATSQEIEFVVDYDANVTPTWKLIRVSTTSSGPGMFDVNRSDTNDLVVSIGPTYAGVPTRQLDEAFFLAKQQSALFSARVR